MRTPTGKRFSALPAALLITALAGLAFSQAGNGAPEGRQTVVLIPLEGLIDKGLFDSVERRITEAEALKPALIVFELETYGGLVEDAIEITNTIGAVDQPLTVAYVPVKAYSAGAMIAMGARRIVLGPLASMGDAAPVMQTPEGMEELGEKLQSPVRNMFRKFAQRNGYPVALAEAMVTKEIIVYRIDFKDGTTEYLSQEELDGLTEGQRQNISAQKVVVKAGEILTMSATEAEEYGFAQFIVNDFDALLAGYELAGAEVVRLEVNWSETLVRALNHPAVSSILLLVGIIGVYMEFKVPGFGLPGTVAILCFSIYFFSKYLSGLAASWEILIFMLGVILLAVEIFLIPGFGVTGFAGITLMLAGLVLALFPQHFTGAPLDIAYIERAAWYFIATLVIAFLAAAGLAKVLPHVPFVSAIYLGPPKPESVPHAEGAMLTGGRREFVGRIGTAHTNLRPAGKALIEGEVVDVTTRGELIAQGARVQVISKKGNNIVVKALE